MAAIFTIPIGIAGMLSGTPVGSGNHSRDRICSAVVTFGGTSHSGTPAADTCVRITSGCKPIQTVPGTGRNEPVITIEYGPSPGIISPSPPHSQGTRGCRHVAHRNEITWRNRRARHPSRRSFGTTRRIRNRSGKSLGPNP